MTTNLLSVIEQLVLDAEFLLANIRRDAPQLSGRAMGRMEAALAAGKQALEQTQGEAGPTSLELPVGYRSPEDWYGWNTMTLFRPAWSKLSKGMQASVAAEYRTALAKLKGESAPEVIHLFSDQLENDPTKRDLVDKDGSRYLPQDAVLANCDWNTKSFNDAGVRISLTGLPGNEFEGSRVRISATRVAHPQATEQAPSTERERMETLSAMAREQLSGQAIVYNTASGLMESVPRTAPSTAGERKAWLIEVKSLGPSWICSISRENGFTRDANKAIQFPTKESAEAVLAHLWKAGRNGTVFGLDSSCYSVTEHIFLGATPPSHDAGKLVESLDSIRRYGLDTLSGRTDGPDDRDWQRQAVNEMTKRATAALLSAPALPVVEPVQFLCDATRFKVRQHEGDEAGRIYGLPSELNGRWVALVAADDDCHLAAARTQPVREPQGPAPTNCRNCGGADNILCAGQCKTNGIK